MIVSFTSLFLVSVIALSSFTAGVDLRERQIWPLFEVITRVTTCLNDNIWNLSFNELCPIFASLNCSTVPLTNYESCVTNRIPTLTDQQTVNFLRQIVPTVNSHSQVLECIKNLL